jgi:multimeric flavodoxin WrbA
MILTGEAGTLSSMPDPTTTKPTNIAVIVAGTNEPSNSNLLADSFIEGIKQTANVEVKKFRLKDMHIEHFTLDRYQPHRHDPGDDFCDIEEAITEAHAVVIATPVWNFSVPAHLKNLIDRVGAFALDEATHSKGQLKAKPFYLIFTGGAPMIAWQALMYLTTLHVSEAIKYYGGTVIAKHFEPKSLPGRGKFGVVVDQRPNSLENMRKKGAKFGAIAMHYAENGSLPARTRLAYNFFSFLYRVGNRIMYPISTLQ